MPSPIRLDDLRHSTAALLLRAGVQLVAVQKVLRHEDSKLTEATYGYLERDFLIDSVDRLRFDGMPEPEPVRARALSLAPVRPSGTRSSGSDEGAGSERE